MAREMLLDDRIECIRFWVCLEWEEQWTELPRETWQDNLKPSTRAFVMEGDDHGWHLYPVKLSTWYLFANAGDDRSPLYQVVQPTRSSTYSVPIIFSILNTYLGSTSYSSRSCRASQHYQDFASSKLSHLFKIDNIGVNSRSQLILVGDRGG